MGTRQVKHQKGNFQNANGLHNSLDRPLETAFAGRYAAVLIWLELSPTLRKATRMLCLFPER
jgi:hypothetical protein